MKRLQGHGTDYQTLGTQGQLLERESRFSEAYDVYDQGLTLTPRGMKTIRLEYMTKLMLAATHSGERAKALKWAEDGNRQRCDRQYARNVPSPSGHRLQSDGPHRRRGDALPEGAHHCRVDENALGLGGKALALLASLESNRGRMSLAMEYADKAISLSPEEARTAHIFKVECLRVLGRFEEAVAHQNAAMKASVLSVAHFERRSQGIMQIGAAWLSADMNNEPDAVLSLDRAGEYLKDDEMLRLWCDATRVWILALGGHVDKARLLMSEVKSQAMRYPDDRNTQLTCCSCPGRGAFMIGDYTAARVLWARYLNLTSSKAWTPLAHFYLGECAAALGETDEAMREYELGAAFGDEFDYARRCTERLGSPTALPTFPVLRPGPLPPGDAHLPASGPLPPETGG